jgi:hypothetical protein
MADLTQLRIVWSGVVDGDSIRVRGIMTPVVLSYRREVDVGRIDGHVAPK